jgi:hypothetical protein
VYVVGELRAWVGWPDDGGHLCVVAQGDHQFWSHGTDGS